jgi:hypothetical protein
LRTLNALKTVIAEVDPSICCSVKANSNLGILKMMTEHGSGFVVVSASELHRVLRAGDNLQEAFSVSLANLKADSRTTAIPIFIYGSLNVHQLRHPNPKHDDLARRFQVQPVNAVMLKQQVRGLPLAQGEVERTGYVRDASGHFAEIVRARNGPLVADLSTAESVLSAALHEAHTGRAAATVLGDVPNPSAQRDVSDPILDPSCSTVLRRQSTVEFLRSIRQFSRLISAL